MKCCKVVIFLSVKNILIHGSTSFVIVLKLFILFIFEISILSTEYIEAS